MYPAAIHLQRHSVGVLEAESPIFISSFRGVLSTKHPIYFNFGPPVDHTKIHLEFNVGLFFS